MAKIASKYWTKRGRLNTDNTLDEDATLPLPHMQSEDDNVERAGYRDLKTQIQELEDAGLLHQEMLRLKYPGPDISRIPDKP